MMNKRTLLLQSISGILVFSCACAFGLSTLQQQQANYTQQFLQTSIQSDQQRNLAAAQENTKAQAQATAQVRQDIGVSKQNNADAQPEQAAPPPSCDCYNMKDSNNLSNKNFYFDHAGLRASRINPPCQCQAPTSDELAAAQKANALQNKPTSPVVNMPAPMTSSHPNFSQPTTAPMTSSPTGGTKNGGSSQFNIKYN